MSCYDCYCGFVVSNLYSTKFRESHVEMKEFDSSNCISFVEKTVFLNIFKYILTLGFEL